MKALAPHAVISLCIGALISFSYSQGLFFGTEHFFEDLLVSEKPVDERIVVLAIDDESLKRLGQWPWPRRTFAEAFLKLNEARPLAVGFDVMLADRSREGGADDGALEGALVRLSYPVVFPVEGSLRHQNGMFELLRSTEPLPQFLRSERVETGHVNLVLDPDGVVRRVPIEIESESGPVRAFAARLSELAGAPPASEKILPIVYSKPPGEIRRFSFYRLLEGDLASALSGKVILIGATSPDLHDEKPTPLSQGSEMPGVEIQANIANMLFLGYRLSPLSPGLSVLVFFLAALLPAWFFSFLKSSWLALSLSVFAGIFYNVLSLFAYEGGTAVNLVHLNLAWVLSTAAVFSYRFFTGERESRYLKGVFSKYVSPQVLESILADPRAVELGGEEKTITVLFSDIRGFTTLSERSTPQELVSILNRYFTLMTREVLRCGGVLDKYIGDAVMAFWGAPLPDLAQADNAMKAARGMLERLAEFNEELTKEKGITIDIGIGLYTGPAVIGNIGSDERLSYTAMGDTVNVASRLEGLNKEYKTHLIIGQSTKEALTATPPLKEIGAVQVKGRKEPVKIYALSEN